MGIWGAGIMDDDLALDMKSEFDEIMMEERDVVRATETVLEVFDDSLEDEDEGTVVILTLAYLQAQAGNLLELIARRA
ncbi:DUF4259 domain-containing protein [Paenibacillus sp. HB172176]|uniref:DUF4259 domain-containing protein n=1 Tax=Paenibacillus sp. HB172176 TaxID=2493690 RepID=UPI00143C0DC6|nr:DUF4259 domain-containing protein [Paenibacillus sp. HB172176]